MPINSRNHKIEKNKINKKALTLTWKKVDELEHLTC
jgi:hypothetical protein